MAKQIAPITSQDIEIALAEKFDLRKNIMVPNAQWGVGLHECDLLMLRPTGYATEFEIKITKQDFRKEKLKDHTHDSRKIKEFYYAVPANLVSEVVRAAAPHAGIVLVRRVSVHEFKAEVYRKAIPREDAIKWGDEESFQLARLGAMRIWKLKKENQKLKRTRR